MDMSDVHVAHRRSLVNIRELRGECLRGELRVGRILQVLRDDLDEAG